MSNEVQTSKRCTKCWEMKPLELFAKNKTKRDGFSNACKSCAAQYQSDNAEKIKALKKAYRVANVETIKKQRQSYYQANAEANREYARNYRAANPEKIREYNRAYYAANAQRLYERSRVYGLANAERLKERQRKYNAANAEKRREYRRDYYEPGRQRARRAAKLDLYRAISNRYRARKKAADGSYTAQQIREMRAAQAGVCAYCKRQYEPYHLQIEHIIPLSQGGSNDISNICLACVTCNCSKKGRTPQQWTDRWYEREARAGES
jgi:5-methylcytosine-specific restriction endonuclease McrA